MSSPAIINLVFSNHPDHAAVKGIHYLISEVAVKNGCRVFNIFLTGSSVTTSFPGENESWNLSPKVVRKKGWTYFFGYHHLVKRLKCLIKRHQGALVICDGVSSIQLVSHVQDKINIQALGIFHGQTRFKKKLQKRLDQQKQLWNFIAVSSPLRQHLLSRYEFIDQKQLHVVPNAVNFDSLEHNLISKEKACQSLGIPANQFVFGVVGRLVPVKNHEVIIQAVNLLRQQKLWPMNTLVVFVGDGILKPDLEKQIEIAGLNNIIITTGRRDNAASHMKAFDTFIMPSLSEEAFGISLLEACAARLPVIASEIDTFREITEEKADYFSPQSAEQLAEKMKSITQLSDTQRYEKGCSLYKYVSSKFDRSHFEARFWKVALQSMKTQ